MADIIPAAIESYCASHSTAESDLLKRLVVETCEKTTAPQMQVGHLEGTFLKLLIRMTRARQVLEIGTFTGYSSLSMAEGLPADGALITCDVDPKATEIAKRYWSENPHGKKITLKLGPAAETLKQLEGPFDFVFIDADKANYPVYWDLCVPKVRGGGLIVVDNVLWSGRVLNPQEASDHHIVEFNRKAAQDSRVELVMLTVRDGMTLAVKK